METIGRKMLAFWIAITLLIPENIAMAEETTASFSVEDLTVERGTIFSIPVGLSGNKGLMGFDIQVIYDSEYMEPIEAVSGDLLKDGIMDDSISTSTNETFHVIWAGTENMKSDGELFQLIFLMKPGVPERTTEIQLEAVQENTYNEQYQTAAIDTGRILVTPTWAAGVKKRSLEGLAVSMEGWITGDAPSEPVLMGNSGDGKVIYTYSDQINGVYSEKVPVNPGRYYLKATVSETEEYFGGVATCTFDIAEIPQATPTGSSGVTSKPTPGVTHGIMPEATPGVTPGIMPETTPGMTPEATPGMTPETTPGMTPETTPGITPATTPGANSGKEGSSNSGNGNTNGLEQRKENLSVPKIKRIKNKKRRQVKITLSERSEEISGYELQYAAKKNFKNATVVMGKGTKQTFTIRGLKKKKKYFIRIRSYQSRGTVIYYSKWSGSRKIRVVR